MIINEFYFYACGTDENIDYEVTDERLNSHFSPFARLLDIFDVLFINPRVVTFNYVFDECRVFSYVAKDLFYDLYPTSCLQKIESRKDRVENKQLPNTYL